MQLDSRFVKVAHDPGDPVLCSHCPFCGSGQITGRSDGGIDCAFCGQSFIVRVQPAFPGMPQAPGMGAPTDVGPDMMGGMPPGMEGEEGMPPEGMPGEEGEGGPPFGEEAGEEEEGAPPGEEEEGEEEGEEGDNTPPQFKKKSALTFRTIAGDELPEDAYVRHLAILLSGHHPAVLARIRREAAGERDWEGDFKKVQSGTCERCGSHVTLTKGHWFGDDNDFMCPDGEEEHQVTGKGPGGQFHPVLSARQDDPGEAGIKMGDVLTHPKHGRGQATSPDFTGTNGQQQVMVKTEGDGRIHKLHVDKLTREAAGNPGYNGHYNRGWRASQNPSERGGSSPLERADDRREPDAWYDGYLDYASDRPKFHSRDCKADHDGPGCTLWDEEPAQHQATARPPTMVQPVSFG